MISSTNPKEHALVVDDLVLYFQLTHGVVQAVDHVSFALPKNRAVVVIGESGCGKTSMGHALTRLLPRNVHAYSGKVYIDGKETMEMDDETYREEIRWAKISLVPQAAMNALNPVLKLKDQVLEPLLLHEKGIEMDARGEQTRLAQKSLALIRTHSHLFFPHFPPYPLIPPYITNKKVILSPSNSMDL